MKRIKLVLLWVTCVVAFTKAAVAEQAGVTGSPASPTNAPSSPDGRQAAQKAFEAGVAAYEAGDYAKAAELFAQAHTLKPHPDVLLNLAQSELAAERYGNAANHLSEYLRNPEANERDAAIQALDQAKPFVLELTIHAPAGARIQVDSQAVGKAPLPGPVYLTAGAHVIASAGFKKSLAAEAGVSAEIVFEDTSAPKIAAEPDGPVATTEAEHYSRQPIHNWFLETPVAWVGAGIAVAGIVTSAITAATASRRYQAADDAATQIEAQFALDRPRGGLSPCGPPALNTQYATACGVFLDYRDQGDSWKTLSVVSLVVGLAAGAGTVTYYFLDPKARQHSQAQSTLAPAVSQSYQGLTWTGTF